MRILFVFLMIFLILPVQSAVMEGGVSKTGSGQFNRVVDSQTNLPIADAKVSVPKQNYTTYTDSNGIFNLNASIKSPTIMSVEKEGYRPFSLTLNSQSAPIIVAIEKSNVQDVVISSEMFHLGDNNFSEASANSSEFKAQSIGPFYTKTFLMGANTLNKTNYLIIGSIIGIDTFMARSMKQNSITNSFASAPEIYFNGSKIAEIQLNGDGQRVKLPSNLIRNGNNEITIKTGRNLKQTAYIDYDDIELMNLYIQSE